MSVLMTADEDKKSALYKKAGRKNPTSMIYRAAEIGFRALRWVAPLVYALQWYRSRRFFGGPIQSYHWIALGINVLVLFFAFSFGIWLLPRMKRLLSSQTFCWVNREETLEYLDTGHLLYSYKTVSGVQVREDIVMEKHWIYPEEKRVRISGQITRTLFDSKGNIRNGGTQQIIELYDYFTPGLLDTLNQ